MQVQFYKYQGTGNDFIILDNRNSNNISLSGIEIKKLCDRRFGIGADGLMILEEKPGYDFEMLYYNSDGNRGSLCGNGSRCVVKYAFHMGMKKENFRFLAADGEHDAKIDGDGIVCLKMNDVSMIKNHHGDYVLDTGSPHYVKFVSDVNHLDIYKKGREIRYSPEFEKEGINVNFVEHLEEPDKILVRTYERGVENETLSCGTGVTASALVSYHNQNGFNEVEVKTMGGRLSVEFDRSNEGHYSNIWLCGPAEKVFDGTIEI
jgi:diaminopimelate epimerase